MPDIRKNFYPSPEHYNPPIDKRSFDVGCQAGRASLDIDGLIAEIELLHQKRMPNYDYSVGYLDCLYAAKTIIRKHFGRKE